MAQVTNTERLLDEAIARHAGDDERVTALERARRFKRSWIDLAEILVKVREEQAHLRWGFQTFDDYCTRELRLRRATVDKLCASFGFLKANAPRLARADRFAPADGLADGETDLEPPIPSWQAVDFVARAEQRGAAEDGVLDEMKRAVFEEGAPLPVLSRKYREVAFPLDADEKRARARTQILATARKLADLVVEPEANLPKTLVERVEELAGELASELDPRQRS